MWHKLSLFGKVLLFLVGFGFGGMFGFYHGQNEVDNNDGNKTEITIDGVKSKNSGDIIIDLDTKQHQEKEEVKEEKKKKFLFF